MQAVKDHVISRTVGPSIPQDEQRWRIDDGPPRYDEYGLAANALAQPNRTQEGSTP